jgi:hypothetical protein
METEKIYGIVHHLLYLQTELRGAPTTATFINRESTGFTSAVHVLGGLYHLKFEFLLLGFSQSSFLEKLRMGWAGM